MDNYAILIKHVTKSFGDETVLKDVSCAFGRGKIHGIVGLNGSGKTVLLKCICGFLHPDKGRIYVDGKQIGKEKDFPDFLGMIIENPGFLPRLSAYKNLKLLASMRGKIGKTDIKKAIEHVGLSPDSKKPVGKYSMGMRERLGIAQAIMEEPSILILDEPFNGLDRQGAQEIRSLILDQKKKGRTILLVSHNAADIDILCDRVYEMELGVLNRIR